jgi:hypothetical protein
VAVAKPVPTDTPFINAVTYMVAAVSLEYSPEAYKIEKSVIVWEKLMSRSEVLIPLGKIQLPEKPVGMMLVVPVPNVWIENPLPPLDENWAVRPSTVRPIGRGDPGEALSKSKSTVPADTGAARIKSVRIA